MRNISRAALLKLDANSYRSHMAHHTFIAKSNSGRKIQDPRSDLTNIVEKFVRTEVEEVLELTDYRVLKWNQRNIYNEGERLIPGLTHDISEVIRHRSSYVFWKRIIELDISLKHNKTQKKVGILDLGCGVGHGCKVLSSIPNTLVTGVDVSEQVIGYARKHYPARNIEYLVGRLAQVSP